jgi:hypothetical protein
MAVLSSDAELLGGVADCCKLRTLAFLDLDFFDSAFLDVVLLLAGVSDAGVPWAWVLGAEALGAEALDAVGRAGFEALDAGVLSRTAFDKPAGAGDPP